MNTDELKSALIKVIIIIGTGVATKYGLDVNLVPAFAAALVTLGAAAWGVYSHWNMQLASEKATTISPAGVVTVPKTIDIPLPQAATAAMQAATSVVSSK